MILKTSSQGKSFAYKSAYSIGPVVINIAFAIFFGVMAYTPDSLIRIRISQENLIYSLIPSTTLYFIWFAQAMTTALIVFGFIYNKRASTFYFSLPVKRVSLFWARFKTGYIMISLPSVLYMLWQLFVNIWTLGYSKTLLQGFIILTISILAMLFTVYSITTAICLCLGTAAEGLVYSLIVIFGLIPIAIGINFLCMWFLHGNAFGESFGAYLGMPKLADYALLLLPSLNLFHFLNRFSSYYYSYESVNITFLQKIDFYFIALMAVWFALSILISKLAAKTFKNYKAENSGVIGVNKKLRFIAYAVIIIFVFGGCSLWTNITYVRLSFALVVSFAAFLLSGFIMTLNIKKVLKDIWQYGVIITSVFAVILLFVSGMFGYNTRQPDLNEISFANITYTGSPDFLPDGVEYGDRNFSYANNNYSYMRYFMDLDFKSASDIETVLQLHDKFIEAGPNIFGLEKDRMWLRVYVQYLLKNGTWITRAYRTVSPELLHDMLILDETEAVKALINKNFDIMENVENPEIIITDALFENARTLEAGFDELINALRKDAEALSLDEKYYPTEKACAVISFPALRRTAASDLPLYFNNMSGNRISNIDNNRMSLYISYCASTDFTRMYITDAYVNTIKFLKDTGLYTDAPDISNISEMYVERFDISEISSRQSPYFRSYLSIGYEVKDKSVKINENDFKSVMNAARSNYYTVDDGYFIIIRTQDENGNDKWTTLFIPETDTPDCILKLKISK